MAERLASRCLLIPAGMWSRVLQTAQHPADWRCRVVERTRAIRTPAANSGTPLPAFW
jgi:hypothetical protein